MDTRTHAFFNIYWQYILGSAYYCRFPKLKCIGGKSNGDTSDCERGKGGGGGRTDMDQTFGQSKKRKHGHRPTDCFAAAHSRRTNTTNNRKEDEAQTWSGKGRKQTNKQTKQK